MAKITLEVGDICEVSDDMNSGWDSQSIDETIVRITGTKPDSNICNVICDSTGKQGSIHKDYLHFKC